jgi:hypothetical protein
MSKGMLFIVGLWAFPVAVFAMRKLGLIGKWLADALNGMVLLVSAVLFLWFAGLMYRQSRTTLNLPKGNSQYLDAPLPEFQVAVAWLFWTVFCGYLGWTGASMILAAIKSRRPKALPDDSAAAGIGSAPGWRGLSRQNVPTWVVIGVVGLLGYAFVKAFERISA